MSKVKETTRYRDAGSGLYITKKQAEKNPAATVKEIDKTKTTPKKKKIKSK